MDGLTFNNHKSWCLLKLKNDVLCLENNNGKAQLINPDNFKIQTTIELDGNLLINGLAMNTNFFLLCTKLILKYSFNQLQKVQRQTFKKQYYAMLAFDNENFIIAGGDGNVRAINCNSLRKMIKFELKNKATIFEIKKGKRSNLDNEYVLGTEKGLQFLMIRKIYDKKDGKFEM